MGHLSARSEVLQNPQGKDILGPIWGQPQAKVRIQVPNLLSDLGPAFAPFPSTCAHLGIPTKVSG